MDAKSLVVEWPMVVTSPNMTYIPFLTAGNVTMRPFQDGRYGYLDFSLWPQIHSPQFAHRPFVLRRDAREAEHLSIMWWTPSKSDGFVQSEGLFGQLGRLDKSRLRQFESAKVDLASAVDALLTSSSSMHPDLKTYYTNFCMGVLRLTHNPYTMCDLTLDVAQTQRHFHDTTAYLRYVNEGWAQRLHGLHDEIHDVNPALMGCWTRDITVVQRYRRGGIPVYFVRSGQEVDSNINIEQPPSAFVKSPYIVTTDWSFDGQLSPLPTVYSGPPSDHMHAAASQQVGLFGLERYKLKVDMGRDSRDIVPVGLSDSKKLNARAKKRSERRTNPSAYIVHQSRSTC